MKVSQLIVELKKLMSEHGDIDVCVYEDDLCNIYRLNSVIYDAEDNEILINRDL